MASPERRNAPQRSRLELRRDLNDAQRDTLANLERYGWSLKFIRRPMFQPAIPVLFDSNGQHHGVLETDGSFNEFANIHLRPH